MKRELADRDTALPARDVTLLRILDQNFADAALRAGDHLVCRQGCTQCCHGAFAVNALDRARLREGMRLLRDQEPTLAEAVEARARQWIETFADEFPGDRVTGLLGESEAGREGMDEFDALDEFDEFANEAACPALNPTTGLCDVYAWRPVICRVFGPPSRAAGPAASSADAASPAAIEEPIAVCELCFTTASPETIEACLMDVPAALEAATLLELPADEREQETVVAWCLVPEPPIG